MLDTIYEQNTRFSECHYSVPLFSNVKYHITFVSQSLRWWNRISMHIRNMILWNYLKSYTLKTNIISYIQIYSSFDFVRTDFCKNCRKYMVCEGYTVAFVYILLRIVFMTAFCILSCLEVIGNHGFFIYVVAVGRGKALTDK